MQGRLGISIFGFFIGLVFYVICLAFRIIKSLIDLFHVSPRHSPPPCLTASELGEHKYVTVNGGQKIHYVESGDPDKPLIVFLHGFPEFWWTWKSQIKYFNKNYRVIALDQRGYNDSGKPDGIESYLVKHIVGDLRGLIKELGVEKFTLVAHDWGSAIAWYYTALYQETIQRLVIMNGVHPVAMAEVRKNSWKQKLMSWYMIFFQSPVLPELCAMADDMAIFMACFRYTGFKQSEEEKEAFKYAFRDYKTWNSTINWYRAAFSKESREFGKEAWPRLHNMPQKTLILHGTADFALSVELAQASARQCTDVRVELIEGVGHWVQNQAPDRVNRSIENFMKE